MQSQLRVGTEPELRIRKALFAVGLRYRCAYPVPGSPRRTMDVAFTRQRVAVFVDGCFWHGCPDHYVAPRRNADWWQDKIAANRTRDEQTNRQLVEVGWKVVRVWEHAATEEAVAMVLDALGRS